MDPSLPAIDVEYSSRRQLPYLGLIVVLIAALVAAWEFGVLPLWIVVGIGAVVFVILVIGAVEAAQSARSSVVLTLNQQGLTVCGDAFVPWSDLREVVIGPLRPAWLFSSGFVKVIAFMPRAGLSLPDPPSARGTAYTYGWKARVRRYGTNLVISGVALTPTINEVASAAAMLGQVPVRQVEAKIWRGWLVILAVAVVVGMVAGAVAGLTSE